MKLFIYRGRERYFQSLGLPFFLCKRLFTVKAPVSGKLHTSINGREQPGIRSGDPSLNKQFPRYAPKQFLIRHTRLPVNKIKLKSATFSLLLCLIT